MAKEEKVPAAVLLKIKKLQELALRGVGGEATNAQRVLEALCEKYDITLEQLEQEEKQSYNFQVRASVTKLFVNCFAYMFGANTRFFDDFHAYSYGDGKRHYELVLTPYEYIEFSQFWEWHRSNFLKERAKMRKAFESAYVDKHSLYTRDISEDIKKEMDKREALTLEESIAIQKMAEIITAKTFHKQIGSEASEYQNEEEEE